MVPSAIKVCGMILLVERYVNRQPEKTIAQIIHLGQTEGFEFGPEDKRRPHVDSHAAWNWHHVAEQLRGVLVVMSREGKTIWKGDWGALVKLVLEEISNRGKMQDPPEFFVQQLGGMMEALESHMFSCPAKTCVFLTILDAMTANYSLQVDHATSRAYIMQHGDAGAVLAPFGGLTQTGLKMSSERLPSGSIELHEICPW